VINKTTGEISPCAMLSCNNGGSCARITVRYGYFFVKIIEGEMVFLRLAGRRWYFRE